MISEVRRGAVTVGGERLKSLTRASKVVNEARLGAMCSHLWDAIAASLTFVNVERPLITREEVSSCTGPSTPDLISERIAREESPVKAEPNLLSTLVKKAQPTEAASLKAWFCKKLTERERALSIKGRGEIQFNDRSALLSEHIEALDALRSGGVRGFFSSSPVATAPQAKLDNVFFAPRELYSTA